MHRPPLLLLLLLLLCCRTQAGKLPSHSFWKLQDQPLKQDLFGRLLTLKQTPGFLPNTPELSFHLGCAHPLSAAHGRSQEEGAHLD